MGKLGLRLTIGVNRRYRSGALKGDEESEYMVGKVTRRGSVRVERPVRLLIKVELLLVFKHFTLKVFWRVMMFF